MEVVLSGRLTPASELPDVDAPPAVPSPAELEYMAFNGHSARVYALLKQLLPEQRHACATPQVLRQAVVGGLDAVRALPVTDAARPATIAFVGALMHRHVELARRSLSRDFLRSLLDWTRFLFAEARLPEAEEAADLGVEKSVGFPELYGRFALEKAACLSARGDNAGAYAVLDALYRRWDLVSDRGVVPDLALALGRAALLTGRVADFKRSLFDGLRSFYVSVDGRRALFNLLRRAHRGGLRLLAGDAATADKLVFAAHWAGFAAIAAVPRGRRTAERAFLGGVYATRYVMSRPAVRAAKASAPPAALVTRAMGGIGDLLMMTPGLRALRARLGRPLHLAVPRRYFAVFDGNDDVELLDIHERLEPTRYPLWFNLTDCPASRVESLTVPRVRRNRIEIFARALGVRGAALRRLDRRPRYVVSERERAQRAAFFESHGLAGRAVVGVQLRAEESYRDYPHMAPLLRALGREHPVLLFVDGTVDGYEMPGVLKVQGRRMREAFALADGCSVLVTPDSAFLHLSAALGIPSVALFGPTDGRVRAGDYPLARPLDARQTLPCVPCWRNEDIACALTSMKASVCLGEITVVQIQAAVRDVLAGRTAP